MKEFFRALIGYLTRRNYARVNKKIYKLQEQIEDLRQSLPSSEYFHVAIRDRVQQEIAVTASIAGDPEIRAYLDEAKIMKAQLEHIYAILKKNGAIVVEPVAKSFIHARHNPRKVTKPITHASAKRKQKRSR